MLRDIVGGDGTTCLSGHRVVAGRWQERAEGRFIQLHNPDRFWATFVPDDCPFDPMRDMPALA